MKFSEYRIAEEVVNGLTDLGLKRPTDIQFKAIPSILDGEDVMAVAQTGTGKTAAFAIPIISQLHDLKISARRRDGVKCIVLVPTHELAQQITTVFEDIAKYTKVKVLGIYGGVDQQPQIDGLKEWIDVVIATPGRMFDLISQGAFDIHRVTTLVLDEADHMLDLGFIKDIIDLTNKLPKYRQTLFFSATINPNIKKLAYSVIKSSAIRIQFSPKDPVSKNVSHAVAFIEMDDKRFFLEKFINEYPESKILIFVRTKIRAERVAKAMERVGINCLTIHSGKEQEEREAILEAFRSGHERLLIGTDVTARGIDIPNVDYVLNYDLPDKAENYVHRVGRTGRAKNKGTAISFCSKEELPILKEIEGFTQKEIERLEITNADYLETKLFNKEKVSDLESLMQAQAEFEKNFKKRKKKK